MASGVTEPRSAGSAASGAVAYLLWARALRDFGDGFVAILLPVYLTRARLFAARDRRDRHRGAARLGAADARHRADRFTPRSTAAAARRRQPDDCDRRRLRVRPRLCPAAGRRVCGHDQPIGGKRQRVRAAGACGAERRGVRSQPHRDVCALQPDRRPERRLRSARRGLAAVSVGRGCRAADGHQGDVRALRPARCRRLSALRQDSPTSATRRARNLPAPSGHRGTSSTGSPRSSASTPSPAASSSSRCWRSGSSSASICR